MGQVSTSSGTKARHRLHFILPAKGSLFNENQSFPPAWRERRRVFKFKSTEFRSSENYRWRKDGEAREKFSAQIAAEILKKSDYHQTGSLGAEHARAEANRSKTGFACLVCFLLG